MATRLYVWNLTDSTTYLELDFLFGQIGNVTSAAIIGDRISGQSTGLGFVEMSDAEDAMRAMERLQGAVIHGREIQITEAGPRAIRTPDVRPPSYSRKGLSRWWR